MTGRFVAISFATPLVLGVLANCASTQEQASPDSLAGCYQFEYGESAKALNLPWGFELTDRPLDNPGPFQGAHVAVTRTTATTQSDAPFAYWQEMEDGTIRIGYPGRGATTLDVRPEGQDLVGIGRSVGDTGVGIDPSPDRTEYPITARRVVCPVV